MQALHKAVAHVPSPVLKPLHSLKRQITRVISKHHGERTSSSCPKDLYTRLLACPHDVPVYNLSGQHLWCRLLEMHDSDSLKVVIEINNKLYKVMTRLVGIDTPEIRTKDEREKTLAIASRDRTAAWALPDHFHVGGKYSEKRLKEVFWQTPVILFIKCHESDKYGRLLATVYKSAEDTESLNDVLIREGYADVYMGGTKLRSWDIQDDSMVS